MDKVYRFYCYRSDYEPDKYLWHQENGDIKYWLLNSTDFIDVLLETLGPSFDDPHATTRSIIKSETIHVDMDKLVVTNTELFRKTMDMLRNLVDKSEIEIKEWLAELEDWVCAKVINNG